MTKQTPSEIFKQIRKLEEQLSDIWKENLQEIVACQNDPLALSYCLFCKSGEDQTMIQAMHVLDFRSWQHHYMQTVYKENDVSVRRPQTEALAEMEGQSPEVAERIRLKAINEHMKVVERWKQR